MATTLPAVLHLKTEEVDTPEKRVKYTVGIVGCGQEGSFYALAFAEAGFKVTCADEDQSVIKRLSKGNIRLGDRQAEAKLKAFIRKEQINATSDLKTAVSGSDVIIITVTQKIDVNKSSNCSEVESACKQIGASLQKGSLIVYGGIAGLGFVGGTVKETLENTSGLKVGEDFGLAYNPDFNLFFQTALQLADKEVTVAANDKFSLSAAAIIFETLTKSVRRIPNVRMMELAVLFAAAQRDLSVALANELAMFCESAGLDYGETVRLIEKDTCEGTAAPTISEETNRDEAYLLLENAENLNAKLRLPMLARQLNEDMARHAVNLTADALRSNGKTLRRARVALLGAADPGTGAAAFVTLLVAKGAKVSRYDPYISGDEQPEIKSLAKKTLNETLEGADCVVVLSAQEQLKRLNLKKLRAVMKFPAALIDLAGVVEPGKVEKEGFAYRGLGMGAWKK